MKVKNDFVTNSSSTSFIIGNKSNKPENLKIKITMEYDLNCLVDETITSLDELYKSDLYKEWLQYRDSKKEILECIQILKDGGTILYLNASNENFEDPVELMIYETGLNSKKFLKDNPNIKVIYSDD